MSRPTTFVSAFLAFVSILIHFTNPAAATFTIAYCSSQNTGSNNQDLYHIYQSNGWCHDQCNGQYAFAIVKDLDCWCSDYIPADQQDTGNCNEACPGFPDEKCGNKDKNLYGYIKLDKPAAGTQGASQPSSSMVSIPPSSPLSSYVTPTEVQSSSQQPMKTSKPSAPPSSSAPVSSPDPETIVKTVSGPVVIITPTPSPSSAAPPPSSSTPAPTSSAAPTTMKTTSSSAAPSSTWTPTPITEVQTLTVSGTVVTKTVTGMSTAPPAMSQSQKKGNSAGTIAGAVIGALLGIALIAGLIFFLLRRHRRNQQQTDAMDPGQSGVQRNVSTMSKQGLLSSNRPYLPPVATSMSRNSRHMDSESISPMSMSDRRNSRPMVYDQRLNPSAIMDMDNASRSSLVTMEDNRDYTRTLNIRNPDPAPH